MASTTPTPLGMTPDATYSLRPCGRVTDYDDSIGGEGEITCGAPLRIEGDTAACRHGHKWRACACGKPNCTGWKVAR